MSTEKLFRLGFLRFFWTQFRLSSGNFLARPTLEHCAMQLVRRRTCQHYRVFSDRCTGTGTPDVLQRFRFRYHDRKNPSYRPKLPTFKHKLSAVYDCHLITMCYTNKNDQRQCAIFRARSIYAYNVASGGSVV